MASFLCLDFGSEALGNNQIPTGFVSGISDFQYCNILERNKDSEITFLSLNNGTFHQLGWRAMKQETK